MAIVIISFVVWGMGSTIRGGSKNIVVVIDKEKYSTQELTDFIKSTEVKKVEADDIEKFLSAIIGE